uniref:Hydrophobin 3 n=1 Tax=Fusarium sp. TaxID=29916 RepID=A0A7G7Y6E7_FUSSX|nr:hydrophobin 3 [Fusarium sp.]
MQFTKIASVLAMAAAAIAAPAPGNYEVEPRTGGSNNGNNQPACSAQSQNVCCNGLGCLVQVLGAGCSTTSYCCQSNSPLAVGALVNINAFNCVKVL